MDLTRAMKSLQEAKINESNKLAEIIKKQNLKKEDKACCGDCLDKTELKEELEGTDPAALNDDIELLEKVNTILQEMWDIKQGGDSEFFSYYGDKLATVCDTVSELLKDAKRIFSREEDEMLNDTDDGELDLEDDE